MSCQTRSTKLRCQIGEQILLTVKMAKEQVVTMRPAEDLTWRKAGRLSLRVHLGKFMDISRLRSVYQIPYQSVFIKTTGIRAETLGYKLQPTIFSLSI